MCYQIQLFLRRRYIGYKYMFMDTRRTAIGIRIAHTSFCLRWPKMFTCKPKFKFKIGLSSFRSYLCFKKSGSGRVFLWRNPWSTQNEYSAMTEAIMQQPLWVVYMYFLYECFACIEQFLTFGVTYDPQTAYIIQGTLRSLYLLETWPPWRYIPPPNVSRIQ